MVNTHVSNPSVFIFSQKSQIRRFYLSEAWLVQYGFQNRCGNGSYTLPEHPNSGIPRRYQDGMITNSALSKYGDACNTTNTVTEDLIVQPPGIAHTHPLSHTQCHNYPAKQGVCICSTHLSSVPDKQLSHIVIHVTIILVMYQSCLGLGHTSETEN